MLQWVSRLLKQERGGSSVLTPDEIPHDEIQVAAKGPDGTLGDVTVVRTKRRLLLTNAAQAMPERGDIFLTTLSEAEHVVVSIRDNGTGIPDEIRSRIFDPFFTTKPPGQGTGLGLSVSYGVITRLGGTIDCHSVEGEGTEFVLRLPRESHESREAMSRVIEAVTVG